jgi:ABC-type multidrug transport system fused ATPase/permease subunit
MNWNKPFWHYLYQTKFHIIMILFHLSFTYLFNPIFLIYITKAILEKDINLFSFLAAIKIFQHIVILPFGRSFVYLYDGVQCSFRSSVQKYLIQIDPIYFTTKSSGEIVAKIERTINAIHTFISTVFEIILPFIIGLGVSIWIVGQSDLYLSVIMTIVFLVLFTLNIKLITFNNSVFLPKINNQEEIEKQYLLENIQQNHFIRSVFATPEQLFNSLKIIKEVSVDTAIKWRAWQYLIISLEIILISFILLVVGYQLLYTNAQPYLIVGTLTSLYNIYIKFSEIGLVADEFSKSIYNQKEFWQFMRTFGNQTYPVLEDQQFINKN